MNKKWHVTIIVGVVIGSLVSSCRKEHTIETKIHLTDSQIITKSSNMTLAELQNCCTTQDDIAFFSENNIVDHSHIYYKLKSDEMEINPNGNLIYFEFRWRGSQLPGLTTGYCGEKFGICFGIAFLKDKLPLDMSTNVDYALYEDYMIILPKDGDNGMTSDGYLPVKYDVYLEELGKSVKSGIYKAIYDEQRGKYTAVVVDFK